MQLTNFNLFEPIRLVRSNNKTLAFRTSLVTWYQRSAGWRCIQAGGVFRPLPIHTCTSRDSSIESLIPGSFHRSPSTITLVCVHVPLHSHYSRCHSFVLCPCYHPFPLQSEQRSDLHQGHLQSPTIIYTPRHAQKHTKQEILCKGLSIIPPFHFCICPTTTAYMHHVMQHYTP